MSIASITAAGQRAAERNMVDTCTIRRRTGETTDRDTGVVTVNYTTVYTGPCRVQQHRAQAAQSDVGQANIYQQTWELQLPMATSGGIAVQDVVTIDACADADLVGRTWWIRDLAGKTHATARRIGMVEVTS